MPSGTGLVDLSSSWEVAYADDENEHYYDSSEDEPVTTHQKIVERRLANSSPISSRTARNAAPVTGTRMRPRHAARTKSIEPELVMPIVDTGAFTSPPRKRKVSLKTNPGPANRDQMRTLYNEPDKRNAPSYLINLRHKLFPPTFDSSVDVIFQALTILKPVVGLFFALGLVLTVAIWIVHGLVQPLFSGLAVKISSPCSLLPFSLLPPCHNPQSKAIALKPYDTLQGMDALTDIHQAFHHVLDIQDLADALGSKLSGNQVAGAHLANVVQHRTKLPSKNGLVFELQGFSKASEDAANLFATYTASVSSGISIIVASNDHTLRAVRRYRDQLESRKTISGVIQGFVAEHITLSSPFSYSETDIITKYIKEADLMDDRISRAINTGHELQSLLDLLNDHLGKVGELVASDLGELHEKQDKLLGAVWKRVMAHLGVNVQENKEVQEDIQTAINLEIVWGQAMWITSEVQKELIKLQTRVREIKVQLKSARQSDRKEKMTVLELEGHIERVSGSVEGLRERSKRREADLRKRIGQRLASHPPMNADLSYLNPRRDEIPTTMGYKWPTSESW